MKRTKIAILGAGFIAETHADTYARFVPSAEVVAVYARDAEKAKAFALRHGIARVYTALDDLCADKEIEAADVCLPNPLHHGACLACAAAGLHVIVEKPLCITLSEADEMIAACAKTNVRLFYGEQMCFAPKYERALAVMESGAIGKLFRIKHAGRHSGPHSRWFYEASRTGGGAMLDMGCHSIGWFLHAISKAGLPTKVRRVFSQMNTVYHDTTLEDEAIFLLEFESGVTALGEAGWARKGAFEDAMELAGTEGVIQGNLGAGAASLVYSEKGYDYSGEKAGDTRGYSFLSYEEAYENGFPQELSHFVHCIQTGAPTFLDGAFGKEVLSIVIAAYDSAASGTFIVPGKDCDGYPAKAWMAARQR